jgi:hypothetical protein
MAGMADQHDLQPVLVMVSSLRMYLGDERAGGVEKEHSARPWRLLGRTSEQPCAEKITGASVSGISSSSSTKMAPLLLSVSTTWRLWTISWRT